MLPEGTAQLIERALIEDIGEADHTSEACIHPKAQRSAHLLVKEPGIIAGVELALSILQKFDSRIGTEVLIRDGAEVKTGDIVMRLNGPARSILTIERLVLNFMQRMSGIATLTRRYVDEIKGTGCTVLDTRKTTPGLRGIEKWAVRIGGGSNHRQGLFDMIMIKDNHVDFAGGITSAIQEAHDHMRSNDLTIPIEVETRDLDEVREVLAVGGVERIMLDNYTPDGIREALKVIDGRVETEASGGINLGTVRAYAETGVDFISVGALTHSVKSLDLSLKAS